MTPTDPIISTFVFGHPRPQGSKVTFANGGMREASKYVKAWREDIRDQLVREWKKRPPLAGPLSVELHFVMPRPKYLQRVKLQPPFIRRPDLDKLIRAVFDAVSMAKVWADDSQVTELVRCHKRYAKRDESSGVYIAIRVIGGPWAGLGGESE